MRRVADLSVRERVEHLLAAGLAAWCSIVRLELWSGVSGEAERAALLDYEQRIPELRTICSLARAPAIMAWKWKRPTRISTF